MSQSNNYTAAQEQHQLLDLAPPTEDIPCTHIHGGANVESNVLQRKFILPRKPLPQYTSIDAAADSEPDSEETLPRNKGNLLAWRPFYLRLSILFTFVIWFFVLIALLEAIYRVSKRQNGLVTSDASLHYLWTYGPSALFIVTATFWARVEYQTKEFAPWQSMAGREAEATKSVLLDYISAFQPVTIYIAFSNGHLTAALASVNGLLFKILIVFSTTLIILLPTLVSVEKVPISILTAFDRGSADLNRTGSLPFFVLSGIQENGLRYPLGVTEELAYQTFNSSAVSSDAILGTSVDAILGDLICEEAQMIVDSWFNLDFTSVSATGGTGDSAIDCELRFATNDCQISDVSIDNLMGSGNTSSYALYNLGHCGQSASDSDIRVVVAAGTTMMGAVKKVTQTTSDNTTDTTTYTNRTVIASTQFVCKPVVRLTTAVVSINQSETVTAVVSTSDPSATTINGLSAWDFVKVQEDGERLARFGVSTGVDLELQLGLSQAGASNYTIPELLEGDILAVAARKFFGSITALYAHLSLTSSASVSSSGTAEVIENRLQVKKLPVRVMEGILALILLLTMLIIFCERDVHALPRSPSTLIALATLVERSQTLLGLLKGTGSFSLERLQQRLAGRYYTSGIVDTGNSRYFSIHVGHQGRDRKHRTIKQLYPEADWRPFIISRLGRALACFALIVAIVASEVLLWTSDKHSGLSDMSPEGSMHYLWTYVPATIAVLISIWYSAIDFDMRCVAPYLGLKKGLSASQTVNLWFLDEIAGTTMLRSIKRKQWTVFVTTLAAIIGSTLTIAVSGVYSTKSPSSSSATNVEATSLFATTYGDISRDTTDYAGGFGYGGVTAGLVMHANLSYPMWTYDELALPKLSSTTSNASFRDAFAGSEDGEIQVRVTATKANFLCRLYNLEEISYHLNLSAASQLLKFNVSSERCSPDLTGFLQVHSNEYFGATIEYNMGICSETFYVWGQTNQSSVISITAMGCNETASDVDADVTFTLPSWTISNEKPPVENKSTLRSSMAYLNPLIYPRDFLPTFSTPQNSNLDKLFLAVVYGRDGIPLTDLGNPERASKVMDSVNHVNSLLRAQYFNEYARIPVNASTASAPFGATFTQQRLRLVQDPTASRVLEALLVAMLLCTIIAIVLTDVRHAVPKNPCSIAAKASLLADSSLVTRELLPEDAERMSDAELDAITKGCKFGIGWFDDGTSGAKVFKVDIVASEEGVSRISVKPK